MIIPGLQKLEEAAAFKWVHVHLCWGKGMLFKRFERVLKEVCLEGPPTPYQQANCGEQSVLENRADPKWQEQRGTRQ